MTERFNQCINSIVFKYVNDQCPNYLNEVFQIAPENNIQTRGSFLKLKYLFRKTNAGQRALSYIGPTIWNKIPDTLKRTKNLNTFKHNLKEHYLKELKNSNSRSLFILRAEVCNIPPFQVIYSFQIGVIPLSLRDHNVNTSNLMHVLRYPAISKSVIFLSILSNITFWHPLVIFALLFLI